MSDGFVGKYVITKALIEGKVVVYNLCSTRKDAYKDWKNIEYLGSGTIYSIDEVVQSGKEIHYFWRTK